MFGIALVGLYVLLPFTAQRLSILYLINPHKRTYKYKIGFLFTFILSLFFYIYPLIDDVYSLFACFIGFLYIVVIFIGITIPSIISIISSKEILKGSYHRISRLICIGLPLILLSTVMLGFSIGTYRPEIAMKRYIQPIIETAESERVKHGKLPKNIDNFGTESYPEVYISRERNIRSIIYSQKKNNIEVEISDPCPFGTTRAGEKFIYNFNQNKWYKDRWVDG
ncbi:MAG: hypothetical protein AAFW70_29225 [Cyanobacteria bacterium J06635_10]